ncbi:MAG: ATP-binding protein, partial [Pseudomonadota bacterium]
QIFEPLKRGQQQENTPAASGSLGLGLYIAREIAKGHGGAIDARSDETGTVFAVRLPRRSR